MVSAKTRDALRRDGWVTVTEAVHAFHVPHSKIYRLVRDGLLPVRRVGGLSARGAKRVSGVLFVALTDLGRLLC